MWYRVLFGAVSVSVCGRSCGSLMPAREGKSRLVFFEPFLYYFVFDARHDLTAGLAVNSLRGRSLRNQQAVG